ncbi:hypothetical protein [Desertivirga brevis]|uniref:hypothetical protein n=1 Tax=Desertivirga brevis TaxID=2810310 RepID=UPI001A96889E|nr:hypothetical protein [Pedobacter sp. SYSU D00873]
MKPQIKYIELKTSHNDDGPAWIAEVELSRSGRTIYFNGLALLGKGHGACTDLETGDIYWISGIKKNGKDRHRAGKGKIMVDRKILESYLDLRGLSLLHRNKYELIDILPTNKRKFAEIENS